MLNRDPATNYPFATFRERGVSLPLTTPMLAGARVRETDRDGLEFMVPKVLEGHGNCVIPWPSIPQMCSPGVHDTLLVDRVSTLRPITPATVREVGLQLSAEGYAGRKVQAAARAAILADDGSRTLTNEHLLLLVVRQLDKASLPAGPIQPGRLDQLAKRALSRLAVMVARDVDTVAAALGGLAACLAPVGLGERVGTARLPSLLSGIQAVRQTVGAMATATPWDASAAQLIERTADVTLSCLARALSEARWQTDDMVELLRTWLADRGSVTEWLCRGEWLADGWTWQCLLWSQATSQDARLQALRDVDQFLPMLPFEATHWAGFAMGTTMPPRMPMRSQDPAEEAAKPSLLARIMRNETLLALAT